MSNRGTSTKVAFDRVGLARLKLAVRDLIQTGRLEHIKSLRPEQRDLLRAYCVENKRQEDIARDQGISQIAISRKIQAAYQRVVVDYPAKQVRDILIAVMKGERDPLITQKEIEEAEAASA